MTDLLLRLGRTAYGGVAPLFGHDYPNLAFVHAVLSRRIPGCVWAAIDYDGRPVACLVATNAPFCFLAGEVGRPVLDAAIVALRGRPSAVLVHPAQMTLGAAAAEPIDGVQEGRRIQFALQPGCRTMVDIEPPAGFELRRVDAAAYRHSNWNTQVHAIFGSPSNYTRHAYGYCLRHNGVLAAEGHCVVGGGYGELGYFTHPDYRHLGLATLVAAAALRHGARRRLVVGLTCDVATSASEAIGRHLGLTRGPDYAVLRLSAGQTATRARAVTTPAPRRRTSAGSRACRAAT